MYEWLGILGTLGGVLLGWYLSSKTQQRFLKISQLRDELEKAYGPLYSIVSRRERAGEKGPLVDVPAEEKRKLDEIMMTYPHMFPYEIVVNWRVNIRDLIGKYNGVLSSAKYAVPVDFKNQITDEYERRLMKYYEATGRAGELKNLPKWARA